MSKYKARPCAQAYKKEVNKWYISLFYAKANQK